MHKIIVREFASLLCVFLVTVGVHGADWPMLGRDATQMRS
jgi:hypothetical protein